MAIRWITTFLDFPVADFEDGVAFWLKATDSTLSNRWGDDREFATLLPGGGDPYLCVQSLRDGRSGSHPDFHVDDLDAEAARARELGAAVVSEKPGLTVLESPGGSAFCFVRHKGGRRDTPPPVLWPGGLRSRLDQICLDVPPRSFDDELAFWQALTGWRRSAEDTAEFRRLLPPRGLPLHFLLQRLDTAEDGRGATAHMDFSCSDVDAETERHVELGAEPVRRHPHWQVMRDPTGMEYCLTDKDPEGDWLADA